MRSKEFKDVPIRRFDTPAINSSEISNFEIVRLCAEEFGDDPITIPPHRHDYYHIMFIEQGSGIHTIDFKAYDIVSNTLFFVSPGQVHALETSKNTKGYVISFDSGFYHIKDNFEKLLRVPFFHSMHNSPVIYFDNNHSKIKTIWDDLFLEYQSPYKDKNRMLRALFEILLIQASRAYKLPNHPQRPSYLSFQLRKLETLIDTHFKTYKMLNDYAELMHMSPRHLNSLAKKTLNKTVLNLIHERCLMEAKRLLLFTTNSISEIAMELGFSDTSYFLRFFKKHTGLTPSLFKTQYQ